MELTAQSQTLYQGSDGITLTQKGSAVLHELGLVEERVSACVDLVTYLHALGANSKSDAVERTHIV